MGAKQHRADWLAGEVGGGEREGDMLAVTSATLFTKNKRKSLQSLFEKTSGRERRTDNVVNGFKQDAGIALAGGDDVREIGSPSISNHVVEFRHKVP